MAAPAPAAAPLPAFRGAERDPAGSTVQERAGEARALLAFFVVCVASRVASTIYYLEDTDSLRFALSLQEYSVARLQPHFPGYPLFWAVAKPLYALIGSYAVAFSVVGALSVFTIAWALLRLGRARLDTLEGGLIAALVFFNPLIWLMSNRYMPDLMGVAWAMAAFHFLVVAGETRERRALGVFLAGMLAGVRLSYLPFLLIPVLVVLARPGERVRLTAAGVAGVLLWLLPLGWATGWGELIAAAQSQTVGHFTDFGGTVVTEPRLVDRFAGVGRGILADGLGGYWPLRHPLTVAVTLGLVVGLVLGAGAMRRRMAPATLWIMAGSWVAYLVWIALYQNVIHKSRHVLPLLPFLLLAVALGGAALWRRRAPAARGVVAAFLLSYAALALVLVAQHRRPTAIAQVAGALREEATPGLTVVSTPLVNFYLDAQGVDARFVSVESAEELAALEGLSPADRVVAVGRFPLLLPGREGRRRVFYHNPYVNRMWSEIEVYEYERASP